jgi:hypothetical protein
LLGRSFNFRRFFGYFTKTFKCFDLSNICTLFKFNLAFFVLFNMFVWWRTVFLIFLTLLLKTIIRLHKFTVIFLKHQFLTSSSLLIKFYLLIDLVDMNHLFNNFLKLQFLYLYCFVIPLRLIVCKFYDLVSYSFTIFSYILY